ANLDDITLAEATALRQVETRAQLVDGQAVLELGCGWGSLSIRMASLSLITREKRVETRAQLVDGQAVLELGCGWGSLSLWMASRFPKSKITAVSNSASQREFINGRAKARGITNLTREFINGRVKARGIANLTVVTADMNVFEPGTQFDRIVSIEMFEHMKNYQFDRIVSIEMFEHMKNYQVPMGKVHDWLDFDRKIGARVEPVVAPSGTLENLPEPSRTFSNCGGPVLMGKVLMGKVHDWLKVGGKSFIHVFVHKHLGIVGQPE
ncbi:S-adenosyl-L-methionine-dependent methyltransferase, partial [Baffinella frigidus]